MDAAARVAVSYNLVDKPWVPVIDEAGTLHSLGLRDVLADAHRLRSVSGDTPAETIGILRLLVAHAQRVFGPASDDDWAAIWQAGSFDRNTLDAYLASLRHRFDLFDVEHPFMQVPSIVGSVEHSVGRLAMERASRTDPVLFDHRFDATLSPMTAAKAARCLLATQAASPGGLMSDDGPSGRTSAKSTPLLNTAFAVIRGRSLFHTLWLNCVLYDGCDRPFPASDDAPAWERDEITRAGERMPRGHLDWLTWQARRVRLGPPQVVDGEIVVRTATIMDGWRLPDGANRASFEQHVGFVRSGDPPVWNALRPESSGLAWRDRLALMAVTHPGHRYGALDALAERRLLGISGLPDPIEIDVLGVVADQAALRGWTDERFSFPAAGMSVERFSMISPRRSTMQCAWPIGRPRSTPARRARPIPCYLISPPVYWLVRLTAGKWRARSIPRDFAVGTGMAWLRTGRLWSGPSRATGMRR